ncbi:uncharacterized protein LOC106708421 [Papilio machaon]|uniref:uncharacterized protein LOC106708421 n=1 Tax=Papilio machaon TaxID=76193 RepID=UPI001E663FC5|nr:uncharacterized protein LOC106708421 [Papilio machaon]
MKAITMCLPMEVFCCCVSLELGTKILGVVHMVLTTLISLIYGLVSAQLNYLEPSRRLFYGLVSASAAAVLLPTCLMTYGAFKQKPKWLWPWVVLSWAASIVMVGLALLGTVLMAMPAEGNSYSDISTMASVYFVYAVILYYSACVVDSRRVELTLEDKRETEQWLMRSRHVPQTLLYEGYEAATFSWTVYIISIVQSIQLIENAEDNSNANFNTTTLYPVDKIPFVKITTEHTNVVKISEEDLKTDRTTWKINTSFAIPNKEERTHLPIKTNKLKNVKDCKESNHIKQVQNDNKESKYSLTSPKENNVNEDETAPKKETEVTKKYKENEQNLKKEFKPSPHLNSYYDTLDDSPFNSFTTSAPTLDTTTFFGSSRDQIKPHHNNHEGYVAFPYKYETYSAVDSSSVWGQSLQSKPTIEAPVRIPAGGLYKLPDVLREKPNSYEENDYPPDSIDNVKDNSLKKRPNPWKSLLHLVTALLPVGLIVSALTPSILTIEDSSNTQQFKRVSRGLSESRLSPALPALPAVSEDCKRRLLCEIHSDRHYDPSGRRRRKQCRKLRCEDPRALSDMLHWLLTYHRATHNTDRGYT